MPTLASGLGEAEPRDVEPPSPPSWLPRWTMDIKNNILSELRAQRGIALPLVAMNMTAFGKTAVTTIFLSRLGVLQLAGGALAFTFANVTGFSVLTGLCSAMEPICGQAHGARNHKLLHKTLLMVTLMLLVVSLPISFLWLNVDKILLHFGQQRDITELAKKYLTYLLPQLVVTSFLCPLKAYLSSQGVTLPTLFSSAIALAFHVPVTLLLVRVKGLDGVAMAIWLTDLTAVIMLATYVFVAERAKGGEGGGWWEQRTGDWARLIRLSAPCCLNTCLEWWCYEILVLLTGRLPDARRMVAVISLVLNFDYLLFSVMLSLATSASTRLANELGAGRAEAARRSAFLSLGLSVLAGLLGGSAMVGVRGQWGRLFSRDEAIVNGVRRTMVLMAAIEVLNFPLTVCGAILRATARPWLGMYASIGGFYVVALPVAVVLAFKVGLGLAGLLLGFLVGAVASGLLLVMFVGCISWDGEAKNAQKLAGVVRMEGAEGE